MTRFINSMHAMRDDEVFLGRTVRIAVPIALQTLLNNVLNLVDTIMIGRLDDVSIAAVGLANKIFFIFSLLLFGIISGASILTAQYWGKRDVPNIRRALGISLILGIGAALIFTIPSLVLPEWVMRLFTNSPDTIKIGASYMLIAGISYPLTAITNVYVALLRSINQVRAPLIVSACSIVINVLLNYGLIFGKLGMPRMGVPGAALATLIARIAECLIMLLIVYIGRSAAAARLKELIAFNRGFLKQFFLTILPVVANEFIWGLGVTLYAVAYGRMGDFEMAAITVTQSVEQLFMAIFQGIGAATTVILGNELGAGRLDRAETFARYFMLLQLFLGLLVTGVSLVINQPILWLFDVTPTTAGYIQRCLLVFSLYAPFKMFNYVNIVGVLRSGGDTRAALLLDLAGVWLVGVPMAFLGGLVFRLPIYVVYAMVMAEEFLKMFVGFWRYRQKKWLRNLVGGDETAPSETG